MFDHEVYNGGGFPISGEYPLDPHLWCESSPTQVDGTQILLVKKKKSQ